MSYLIISIAAIGAAALTLFSGFGLGTLLMPVFAIFFPIEVAVAATAVVHLANNLFKVALVGRKAHWPTLIQFSVPAVIAAVVGAWLLTALGELEPWHRYEIGQRSFEITPLKMVIAIVIAAFAVTDLWTRGEGQSKLNSRRWLWAGGLASGFFGGLSGHQGAMRAAVLIRAGLTRDQFIGTSVASSVMVDVVRLVIYGLTFFAKDWTAVTESGGVSMVIVATLAAFVGSMIGVRLVRKVTFVTLRRIVGTLLLVIAIALGLGLV